MSANRVLKTVQWLAHPIEQVFPFFADPHNLPRITPQGMAFKITTPGALEMREGLLIDYRLRVRGLPARWTSRITAYDPPTMFVDDQVRGPYAMWHHIHTFSTEVRGGVAGTLVEDEVNYALPRWIPKWLERGVHAGLVKPDLDRIFAFRNAQLKFLFPE